MKKKVLSLLLAVMMVFSLMTVSVSAETSDGVAYIDAEGTAQTHDGCTVMTDDQTEWSGWYYVNADVTINGNVILTGDVTFILADGKTLTVNGAIDESLEDGECGSTINGGGDYSIIVYGQTGQTGKLDVTGTDSDNSDGYNAIHCKDLSVYGGVVKATGGNTSSGGSDQGGQAISVGKMSVSGGAVEATGGDVTAPAEKNPTGGGGTAIAVGASFTVSGGKVTATGGVGSNETGAYAIAVGGSFTVSGGEVIATGGNGMTQKGGSGGGTAIMCSVGDLIVSGGKLTAIGGNSASDSLSGGPAILCFGSSLTVSGGVIEATGGKGKECPDDIYGHAIVMAYGGAMTVDGGSVIAAGGEGTTGENGSSAILFVEGSTFVFKSGSFEANGGAAGTGGENGKVFSAVPNPIPTDAAVLVGVNKAGASEWNRSDALTGFEYVSIARELTPWTMLNGAIQDESEIPTENDYFSVTYPEGAEKTITLKQNITAGEDDGPLNVCKTNVRLDLKGYTLDRGLSGKAAVENGHVFIVSEGFELTIVDSSEDHTGTITGGNAFYGGAVYITGKGSVNLIAGTITDCHAFSETYDWQNSKLGRGGAVFMEGMDSYFYLAGEHAKITNCTASVAGGAVYVSSGNFIPSNGLITGCSVSGLTDDSATSSTKGKTKAKGGAVYLLEGSMQMDGGEISGNTLGDADIMNGAGVYVSNYASFAIGKKAKIFGNTDSKGNANNVYLRNGKFIEIMFPPESGMSIGVMTETAPEKDKPVAFAKGISSYYPAVLDYFHADSPICKIGYTEAEGGTLWLELDEDAVCHYLEEVDEPVNDEHYTLKLNGREVGEYEFHRDNDSDPRSILKYTGSASVTPQFLTVENGRLAYTVRSDESNWVFDENGFHTTVTTSTQIPGFWFLFWYIPASTRITSTTYYLSTTTEGVKLSTRPVRTGLYTPTSGPHLYGEPVNNCDGTHTYTCERCGAEKAVNCAYLLEDETYCECGAYNPAKCDLDVECTPGRKTVYGWFWTRYTVFTMEIKAIGADAEDVIGIEYSIDGGRTWHRGTTITANTEIIFFKVRVTDDHGTRIFSFPNNIADSIR